MPPCAESDGGVPTTHAAVQADRSRHDPLGESVRGHGQGAVRPGAAPGSGPDLPAERSEPRRSSLAIRCAGARPRLQARPSGAGRLLRFPRRLPACRVSSPTGVLSRDRQVTHSSPARETADGERFMNRRLVWVAFALSLAGGLALAAFRYWPRSPEAKPISDDPRLTYPTPYLNVDPGVKYVG